MLVPRLTGPAALCFGAPMVGAVTITWAMGGAGVLVAFPAAVGVVAAVVAGGRPDSTRRPITQLCG